MPIHPVRSSTDQVFLSFVRELARSPQVLHILMGLRDGHQPDPHGRARRR